MALAFVFDIPDGLPPSRLKKAGKRVNGRLLGSWVKPGPRWLVDGKVLVVAPHDTNSRSPSGLLSHSPKR
jgi:hypothetical protein